MPPDAWHTLCYCAEHRHAIPGFEKLDARIVSLETWKDWAAFESVNAARATKVAGGTLATAAVIAPAAFFAAPVVGAALGGSALGGSLTGAAATSHGLAMLGGGSIASGGLGMAGGTAVVTATGSALGGALGASTVMAYAGADKSFDIVKLRDGVGPAVVLASGFLTEGDSGWGPWQELIDQRFADSPVYRVHWGAHELKKIAILMGGASAKVGVRMVLTNMAKKGSKAFGRLSYIGAVLLARDVTVNPWSVAKNRAGMTGAALADILARTEEGSFILVGHSLGARVMVTCAQTLGSRGGVPRIDSMHLLGAAVGRKGDWGTLDAAVSRAVFNYWSPNDEVLRRLYVAAEFGQRSAGQVGFGSTFAKIKDRNVGRLVRSHSGYFHGVKLARD
jgi:pimeloyl-ACP methyl ester carboxylesterase